VLIRGASILSFLAAFYAALRALSGRIPQMGKPYYSDDGTLSALMSEKPRDLSIPWGEVIAIVIELLGFLGIWFLVFSYVMK
jgi:hypothetical protein